MELTTAVRLPTVGLTPKVTTSCVGEEVVTVPVAPRLKETALLALLEPKPKPLIVTVESVVWMDVVLAVITGMTVATCTAEPLLTLLVVTEAVKEPALAGLVPKVTVREVLEAAETVPVALLLKVTTLFTAVESKPKPLMVTVVALAARLVVEEVTTGATVATCLAVPLLPPKDVTTAVRLPTAAGWALKVTPRLVAVAEVTVPVAPLLKTTVLFPGDELSKPVPAMVTVVELMGRLVVAKVTVGAATMVAT